MLKGFTVLPSKTIAYAVCVVGVVSAARGAAPQREPAAFLEQLRNEATAEWDAMAQRLRQCSFQYTVVEIDRSGREAMTRRKRVSGRVAGDQFLVTESLDHTEQVSVYGRNDRYEFAIARSGESPWTVSWQSAPRGDESPVGSAFAYLNGMLHLPCTISATPLAELVRHPGFSVRYVRPLENGLVEFGFALNREKTSEDDLQGLTSGLVVLDSSNHWAIARYHVRYASQISSQLVLDMRRSAVPEIGRAVLKLRTGPQQAAEFVVDAPHYDWNDPASTQFELPAFGLPHYVEPGTRRLRWQVVNVGIVFLLLGLIIWRGRQQRSDTA